MAAQEVLIADAVTAELNDSGRSFALLLDNPAVRTWSPWYDEDEKAFDTLRISVVATAMPKDDAVDRAGLALRDYEVWIDFQQRIALDTATGLPNVAAIDALCLLVQDVQDWFIVMGAKAHELATLANWHVIDARRELIFDENILYQHHVFFTAIKLTVRGFY